MMTTETFVTWRVILKCSHVKLAKRSFDYMLPDVEHCLKCDDQVEVHNYDLYGLVTHK